MHGRRDEHALARRRRALEDHMADEVAARLVEQVVSAAAGQRLELGLRGHAVDGFRVHARAVDHVTRLVSSGSSRNRAEIAVFGKAGDLAPQPELGAVPHGDLSLGDAQPPRVDDRRGRRVQRRDDVCGQRGLHPARLLARQHFQPWHAVLHAVFIDPTEGFAVLLAEAQHQRADALVLDRKVSAQLLHHRRALHVQLCHQRPRLRVVACVDDRAVGLCRAHRHVVLAFKHQHPQVIAAQRVRQRRADHPAAYDGHIIHSVPSLSVLPGKQKSQKKHTASLPAVFVTLTQILQARYEFL